jgi:hypothetical protein
VGLITGIVTLPLAPVRATAWLAERIAEQAEAEMQDGSSIRVALLEIEELRATGELDDEELDAAESALVAQLMAARGFDAGADHGSHS